MAPKNFSQAKIGFYKPARSLYSLEITKNFVPVFLSTTFFIVIRITTERTLIGYITQINPKIICGS